MLMRPVIVIDGERSWIRLLAWFLSDAGHAVTRCAGEAEVIAALASHPRALVVINTAAGTAAVRRFVDCIRPVAPAARIVEIIPRAHEPGDRPSGADVCIHAVADAQTAIDEIQRILRAEDDGRSGH